MIFQGDRDLLQRFRDGERDALERVYRHYVDEAVAVLRFGFWVKGASAFYWRGTDDEQTQRDMVQELFLRAFSPRARQSFDGLSPYRPYLLRILKNLLIDRHRAGKHESVVPVSTGGAPGPNDRAELDLDLLIGANAELQGEPAQSSEDALQWKRDVALARSYIAALDDEARRFVQLRFEDELSQAEVARHLGASERRVRTLEKRVRRGLAKVLRRGWRPDSHG